MPRQKPGQSNQDIGTPDVLLSAACRRLRILNFGWDLAASAENAIHGCGPGRGGEGRFFDIEQNGLAMMWPKHGWSWLNPPFGGIKHWALKCCEEAELGASTAMLIPASPGANWWAAYVDGQAYVLFLNGRVTFKGHDKPYPKDLALVLYTPAHMVGYEVWDWRV
jgi:hypothetical protein